MAALLKEIATETGLQWYNEPGPFKSSSGSVIGIRDGFLVSIGLAGHGMRQGIGAAIRFRRTSDAKVLLEAMNQIPDLKRFSGGSSFKVAGQTFVWSFSKPVIANAKNISEDLDTILRALASRAEPFTIGKCEGDNCTNDVAQVTLINGNSNLICEPCKIRVLGRQLQKQKEYESSKTDYVRGSLYCLGAAVLGGLGSGLISYATTDNGKYNVKLFAMLPLMVVLLATFAAKRGLGQISKPATLITLLPCAAGILFSNTLFYTLLYSKDLHVPLTAAFAARVFSKLWLIKWTDDMGKFVVVMEFLCALLSPMLLWEMRPKFGVTFKTVGTPVITHSGIPKVASVNA